MHAGRVFHPKVREKCCRGLTFGPRDHANEHNLETPSHPPDLSFPDKLSFAPDHLGLVVIREQDVVWRGNVLTRFSAQTCLRALEFLVQKLPLATLEKTN